jgi:hypothetical protein
MAAVLAFVFSTLLTSVAAEMPPLLLQTVFYSKPAADPRVIAFSILVAVSAVLLFGLAPALMASRKDPWCTLKGTSLSGWRFSGLNLSVRHLLLASQVGVAVVLAIIGGLYAQSLYNLSQVDLGFPARNVLLIETNSVALPREERIQFDHDLLPTLRSIPRVTSASYSQNGVLPGVKPQLRYKPREDADFQLIATSIIASDHFRTIGFPLKSGREFEDRAEDIAGTIIINEELERRLWPDESAIGRRLLVWALPEQEKLREIIGVVSQRNCFNHLADPEPCIYYPYTSGARTIKILEVATPSYSGLFEAVEKAIHTLKPNVLVFNPISIEDHFRTRIGSQRIAAIATAILASIGILLAAIGCVAVFAAMAREKRHEVALRMALGATSRRLVSQMLTKAVAVSLIGGAAGMLAALLISSYLADQFYRMTGLDVATSILVLSGVLGVALTSSYLPTRAITKTDPAEPLKVI